MESPSRPRPPTGPRGLPLAEEPGRPHPRWPEPPAFRDHPSGGPPACASCSTPIGPRAAPPLCWGCGRPLCPDCYWRHGLTPAAHQCASCLARGSTAGVAISGGRSSAPQGRETAP